MTPQRLAFASSAVLASVALLAAVVSGQIVVVPRDPPEPLDAPTAELLALFQDGKDAAGEIALPSAAGACAGCHRRSLE